LPGYAFPMWVALFAPAKTPKPIIEKMSSAAAAATASPLIKKRYEDLLVEPVASTPEALAQFLDEQLAFNKDIIEKAKIRVQ
jgi:tripartite-type tricarboxylate transporter receptor subunit TctC